jgi:hypothetical protein
MRILLVFYWLLMMPQAFGIGIITDLNSFDEDKSLGPQGEARIYAVEKLEQTLEPLILVHGIQGKPQDLKHLIEKFKPLPYQLYVLAYKDVDRRTSLNGEDFAQELLSIRE